MDNTATSAATRPPSPAPRLRVVAADRETTPRHRSWWKGPAANHFSVEVITESEWADLHPSQRLLARTVRMPGIGYVVVQDIDEQEGWEIERERGEAMERQATRAGG